MGQNENGHIKLGVWILWHFYVTDTTCLDTCMRDTEPGQMERLHLWTPPPATKDTSQLIPRCWSKWQERNISQRIDHQFSAQIFTKKQCTSDVWCFWYFIFKYCKNLQNFNQLLKEYRNFDHQDVTSHLYTFDVIVVGLCSLMLRWPWIPLTLFVHVFSNYFTCQC